MKTSPNQAQSSGYSFAGNAPVDKRTDHAVSKKEIILGCVVVCFFTIMAMGAIISMYNEPQSFPVIAYSGVALFPIISAIFLILRIMFPSIIRPGRLRDDSYINPANTSGSAVNIRKILDLPTP